MTNSVMTFRTDEMLYIMHPVNIRGLYEKCCYGGSFCSIKSQSGGKLDASRKTLVIMTE